MGKTFWILLTCAVLMAVLLGAGVYMGSKLFIKLAMERAGMAPLGKRRKKVNRRLWGMGSDDSFMKELKTAGERLKNRETRRVETVAQDGTKLVGHLLEAENPKRIMIGIHGWRSSWARDFGAASEFWHANDSIALFPEQRGQGESGGDYITFGLLECHDCVTWVNWVNEHLRSDLPVYLVGASMGATTVMMAAGLDLPQNVKGIIADCGFTSPAAEWKHVIESNFHIPYGIFARSIDACCRKAIGMGGEEYTAPEALRRSKTPVLFVHGTDDHFVPVEMVYENYEACAAPKRLLVVPGANHGMSYYVQGPQYEQATRDVWQGRWD